MTEQLALLDWAGQDAIRILEGDPEPRMSASALAELLEHKRLQSLIELAGRHKERLLEFALVLTVRSKSHSNEWDEPWYTESQCLYLAAKSETDVANAITVRVIKLFEHYRRGLLIPNGSQVVAILQPELEAIKSQLQSMEDRLRVGQKQLMFLLQGTHDGVQFCVQELSGMRKPLSEHTRRVHCWFIETKFGGECPVCRSEKIAENGEFLPNARNHHNVDRSRSEFNCTIVICEKCHKRFHQPGEDGFRADFWEAFNYYHRLAKELGGTSHKQAQPCVAEQADIFKAIN